MKYSIGFYFFVIIGILFFIAAGIKQVESAFSLEIVFGMLSMIFSLHLQSSYEIEQLEKKIKGAKN